GFNNNNVNVVPILLNQRFFLDNSISNNVNNRTYAFVGLGASIVDVRPSATVFAGRVGLGFEVNPQVIAELAFNASTSTRGLGVHSTFIAGTIGYRF